MKDTKSKILETSLELFAQRGYGGTSMSDIAAALGVTKAALYKHYESKREIFDSIVARMRDSDGANAENFDMPLTPPKTGDGTYTTVTKKDFAAYAKAQFRYWTQEKFPSEFRKMLSVERFSDEKIAKAYADYLSSGPTAYVAEIFSEAFGLKNAEDLAARFYGGMYLYYDIYDFAPDKAAVTAAVNEFIDNFLESI